MGPFDLDESPSVLSKDEAARAVAEIIADHPDGVVSEEELIDALCEVEDLAFSEALLLAWRERWTAVGWNGSELTWRAGDREPLP